MTKLKVIETSDVRDKKLTVVEILEGEPLSDMILKSEAQGSEWKISGSAFVPAKTWSGKTRGLLLKNVGETDELNSGEFLISI